MKARTAIYVGSPGLVYFATLTNEILVRDNEPFDLSRSAIREQLLGVVIEAEFTGHECHESRCEKGSHTVQRHIGDAGLSQCGPVILQPPLHVRRSCLVNANMDIDFHANPIASRIR
jgi:hypothetical protein